MQKFLKEYLPYIIVIIIVILVKIFFITPVRVKGVSMNNTLKDKDIMLLNKAIYRHQDIKRFDIVVIKMGNEEIIKRVIGLPGDEVVYKNNKLYINNKINYKKMELSFNSWLGHARHANSFNLINKVYDSLKMIITK